MTSHSWFLLGIIITAGPLGWLWVVALLDLEATRKKHEEEREEWARHHRLQQEASDELQQELEAAVSDMTRLRASYDELTLDLDACRNGFAGAQPSEAQPAKDRPVRSQDLLVEALALLPKASAEARSVALPLLVGALLLSIMTVRVDVQVQKP